MNKLRGGVRALSWREIGDWPVGLQILVLCGSMAVALYGGYGYVLRPLYAERSMLQQDQAFWQARTQVAQIPLEPTALSAEILPWMSEKDWPAIILFLTDQAKANGVKVDQLIVLPSVPGDGYQLLAVEIFIRGSYDQVQQFLQQLDNAPVRLTWGDLRLEGEEATRQVVLVGEIHGYALPDSMV